MTTRPALERTGRHERTANRDNGPQVRPAASTYAHEAVLALARMQAAKAGHPLPESLGDLRAPAIALLLDAVSLAMGYADDDRRLAAIHAADAAAVERAEEVAIIARHAHLNGGSAERDVAWGSLGRTCARAFKDALMGRG